MGAGDRTSQPVRQSLLSLYSLCLLVSFTSRLGNCKEQRVPPGWRWQQEAKQPRGAAQGKVPGLLGIGAQVWRVGNSWLEGNWAHKLAFSLLCERKKHMGTQEKQLVGPREGWGGALHQWLKTQRAGREPGPDGAVFFQEGQCDKFGL